MPDITYIKELVDGTYPIFLRLSKENMTPFEHHLYGRGHLVGAYIKEVVDALQVVPKGHMVGVRFVSDKLYKPTQYYILIFGANHFRTAENIYRLVLKHVTPCEANHLVTMKAEIFDRTTTWAIDATCLRDHEKPTFLIDKD